MRSARFVACVLWVLTAVFLFSLVTPSRADAAGCYVCTSQKTCVGDRESGWGYCQPRPYGCEVSGSCGTASCDNPPCEPVFQGALALEPQTFLADALPAGEPYDIVTVDVF